MSFDKLERPTRVVQSSRILFLDDLAPEENARVKAERDAPRLALDKSRSSLLGTLQAIAEKARLADPYPSSVLPKEVTQRNPNATPVSIARLFEEALELQPNYWRTISTPGGSYVECQQSLNVETRTLTICVEILKKQPNVKPTIADALKMAEEVGKDSPSTSAPAPNTQAASNWSTPMLCDLPHGNILGAADSQTAAKFKKHRMIDPLKDADIAIPD